MMETINYLELIIAALMLINALVAIKKALTAKSQNNLSTLFFQSSLAFAYIIFPAIVLWPDFLPHSWKIVIEFCIVIVLVGSLIVNIKGSRGNR